MRRYSKPPLKKTFGWVSFKRSSKSILDPGTNAVVSPPETSDPFGGLNPQYHSESYLGSGFWHSQHNL